VPAMREGWYGTCAEPVRLRFGLIEGDPAAA
jgi:hypothetical protein